MKRFLYLILAFMLTAPLFTFVASAHDEVLPKDYSSSRVEPASVGSKGISPMSGAFISPWLYNGFTDAEWKQEIAEWKLLGIEYIIMADVATINIDDDYSIQAAFPTKLEGATQTSDSVTKIFEKCSANDIKVIIGTGNTSGGWGYIDVTSAANVETFKKVCARFADIAEDIYGIYHDKYKDSFAGFYFAPELFNSSQVDNEGSRKRYVEGLTAGIDVLLDRLTELDGSIPFFMSPYVNLFGGSWVSKNYDNLAKFWSEFFATGHFRDGDVLIPQDSCGAGGCDTAHLEDMTKAYRKGVDECGKDIRLWSNCEIFIQPKDLQESGFVTWSTMPIGDMIEHFYIVSKYVDRIFTFAYPHYLGTVTTVDGYYNTYVDYLKTGVLDSEPPKAPDTFRTMFNNAGGTMCLNVYWSGMYDNYGIHRINIYKNGEFFTFRLPIRKDYASARSSYPNNFYDLTYTEDTAETVTYEFEAIDCAGNVSERTKLVVEPGSVPNGVKLGSPYTGPKKTVSETSETSAGEESEINGSMAESTMISETASQSEEAPSESRKGLIIGVCCGIAAVAVLTAGVLLGRRKKK